MPQSRGEGVVLRSSNLGEWDKLLVVLGQGSGKMRIVAKGARKVQSRYASLTQVFCYIRYTIYSGRNMSTFSQAELIHGFPVLRDDLDKMAYGLYILELVDSFLEDGQIHDDILSLLLAALHILNHSEKHDLLLAFFQIRLLARLGWAVSARELSASQEARQLLTVLKDNDWRAIEEFEETPVGVQLTDALNQTLFAHLGRKPKAHDFLVQIQNSKR
jgi:DNA repair protein RecO (recombination protein O)